MQADEQLARSVSRRAGRCVKSIARGKAQVLHPLLQAVEKRQLPPKHDKQAFGLGGGEVAGVHAVTL